MEFEDDVPAADGVAVAHDRAGGGRRVVRVARAIAFEVCAVVDGPAGPTAPMGMVRAEVVADFVGHHLQIPGVRRQIVDRPGVHVCAEPDAVGGTAHDVEVGDAAGSGVRAARHQVHEIAVDGRQRRGVLPRLLQASDHSRRIADKGGVRIGGFPDVHVGSAEVDQIL